MGVKRFITLGPGTRATTTIWPSLSRVHRLKSSKKIRKTFWRSKTVKKPFSVADADADEIGGEISGGATIRKTSNDNLKITKSFYVSRVTEKKSSRILIY